MDTPMISSEMVPNAVALFWKQGDGCVSVSQPETGLEITLTGTTRLVWDYLRTHKESSVGELIAGLQGVDRGLDEQRLQEVLAHLLNLGLVTLDEPLDW